ncbi:MAG: DUF1127 domain-containing protein [Pseudomonadota bacterium]
MTTLAHTTRQHTISVTAGKPFFAQMISTLNVWSERATQRRHLAGLTRRELDDVGISREAARLEASKPFWRA